MLAETQTKTQPRELASEKGLVNPVLSTATAGEAPQLAELARTTYISAYAHEMTADALQRHIDSALTDEAVVEMLNGDIFFVARMDERIVGFVQMGRVDRKNIPVDDIRADDSQFRRVYIDPPWQSQGIGSQLLTYALADARTTGRVFLDVWETNVRAQRFYESHGFKRVGEREVYRDDGTREGAEFLMMRTRQHRA